MHTEEKSATVIQTIEAELEKSEFNAERLTNTFFYRWSVDGYRCICG
jgi:hypothetical protein